MYYPANLSFDIHNLEIKEKMDLWSIFLSLLLVFVLTQSLIFLANKTKSKKLPPGPTPLPIIGNLHILGQKPHQSLANLAKIYGPIMSLKLGRITTIVISSSSMARQILQKQDLAFSTRFVPDATYAHNHYQYSVAWLPVSTRWRSMRKIMSSVMFSLKGLDANQHLRNKKVHDIIDHCAKSCKDGKAVDIGTAGFLTSLNLISNTIFSRDLTDPNEDSDVKELKDLICNILKEAGKPNLADYFPVLKMIDPQGIRRRVTVKLDRFLKLLDRLINERLELRKTQKNAGHGDLLDMCLDISEKNPEEIDLVHIPRMFLDLFFAGTDTTSSTLEWAVAELLRNQAVMIKAKMELDQVIGKGKILEESDITRLPYLQCIIKETLRLHPPVPFLLPRKVDSDVEVNDYIVPKGSQVLVNAWAIGREPTLWEDSLNFNPDRFLTSERDIKGQDFELIPFGAGRRICPGLPMAMRVVSVILGSLLNSFEWKLKDGEMDMSETFGLTLHKARPLYVVPMPLV